MNHFRPSRSTGRLLGALLLALALLPGYRLLNPERTGTAGASTLAIAEADAAVTAFGLVVLGVVALALALTTTQGTVTRWIDRVRGPLSSSTSGRWAVGTGALAFVLGAASALLLHRGRPRLLDEMSQLLHAKVFQSGRLALPMSEPQASRLIQNSVVVPEGWASIYPPGHTALLAGGFELGAPWLVGPLLLGVTCALASALLQRLYPDRPGTARLAGLAIATSPFLTFLGSGYLSHVTAAAAGAAACYGAVRAWQGRAAWGLLSGAAVGLMVTTRPWTGLTLGAFLTVVFWSALWHREGRSLAWLVRRSVALGVGGAPFAAALFWYNRRLFGSATRFGYDLAFGPAHGLGLHTDPWGNAYGLTEALAYTSADVVTLGLRLFETPVPAVGLVGIFLLLAARTSVATRLLLGWATVPILANAFYWHHGQHLGPRMLFEAAPAWAALTVIAVVGLVDGRGDPGLGAAGHGGSWGASARSRVVFWLALLSIPFGLLLLLPARVDSLRRSPGELALLDPPTAPDSQAGHLVFVHGAWPNRVASTLAELDVRRDSIETALRRNDLCKVQLYADHLARGARPEGELDWEPRTNTPSHLRLIEIVPGLNVRLEEGALAARCVRELNADRGGVVELAPLLWTTALPAGEHQTGDLLLFRDLGPERNAAVIALHPGRTLWLWSPDRAGQPPRLRPYGPGMTELWGPQVGIE